MHVLDLAGVTIGASTFLIFCLVLIFMPKHHLKSFFINISYKNISINDFINFIFYMPFSIYNTAICSTVVPIIFSEIFRTYNFSYTLSCALFIFISLFAVLIRYICLLIIVRQKSNNISVNNKYRYILQYLTYFAILSCLIDVSSYRSFCNCFIVNESLSIFYTYVFILLSFIFSVFLINKNKIHIINFSVLFTLICTLCLFCANVYNNISYLYLKNIVFIKLNILDYLYLDIVKIIKCIFYSFLFVICSNDLFCLCMDSSFVNYSNNLVLQNKIKKEQYDMFLLLSSLVISLLSCVWFAMFINMSIYSSTFFTYFQFIKCILFLNSSIMQSYLLVDLLVKNNYLKMCLILLILLIFNYLYCSSLNRLGLIIFLISQTLNMLYVLKNINMINKLNIKS